MDGDLIIREHTEQHYRTVFNRKTGFFVRKEEHTQSTEKCFLEAERESALEFRDRWIV